MKNKFRGVPIIEFSEDIPSANFLKDEFGKKFFKEYERKVKWDYGNNSLLKVLNYDCDYKIVTGSNPFAVVLANQILSQQGLRTANLADLERIIRMNALELRKTYIDFALVLMAEDCKKDKNRYLTRELIKQIKKRIPKLELPIMINLTDLELTRDENSEYGLAFKLKEDATIYASISNKPGRDGLPKQTKQDGKHKIGLYGLYRLCLKNFSEEPTSLESGLDAHEGLEGSGSLGRIVVINDGPCRQNSLRS